MKTIFTIGYEKIKINEFLSALKDHNIDTLIDVRENPYSFRRDFIRKYLSEILHEHNIEYIHIKELGTPKWIRAKYKEDKNITSLQKRYGEYIKQKDLLFLGEILKEKNACLMCYEENPFECHRIILAFELYRRGFIDDIKDIRRSLRRDEILLFCENLSNSQRVLFRSDLHSWDIRVAIGEKRISQSLSCAL